MSILDGFYSLGQDLNKTDGKELNSDTMTGVVSQFLPELTLEMEDEDLIKLTQKWESQWNDSKTKGTWLKQIEDNENYWLGKQSPLAISENNHSLQDNLIFQAVETYLPAATRQNPEPLVELDSREPVDDDKQKYTEIVRNRLADWSDATKFRVKLKKTGRNWLIYLLGVGKMACEDDKKMPTITILRPKKLILDPNGVTDEDGYSGKYVGEHRKLEASELLDYAKDDEAKEKIKTVCKGELGTDIGFIEWWTNEYTCWILDKTVILKKRNPYWNYDEEETKATPISGQAENGTAPQGVVPETAPTAVERQSPEAQPGPAEVTPPAGSPPVPVLSSIPTPTPKAQNHFTTSKMPYVFLVIFNLGKTPVDETSLITQILPQQDQANKRLKQIDKNADSMNNGMVISEEKSGLTKEDAKQVNDALRKGGSVVIPTGSVQDAIGRFPSPPLPPDVYNQLNDTRSRIYDLFGIRGITPAGIKNEDTVRGKIITKGLDTDRIGGGVTEYFEQFADDVYNWVVQLYYVYDDIFIKGIKSGAVLPKIKVSVKEGSLLPKDATTKANQAIELANAGKMSLVDLYKALEFPNPEEMAARVWLEANAPELLFKDDPMVQEAIQMKQQAAQAAAQMEAQKGKKGPSESISFKDLPPDGKTQMAEQAGIKLSEAGVAAHEQANKKPVAGSSELSKVPVQ